MQVLVLTALLSLPVHAAPIQGDCDQNGQVDISDAVALINFIFLEQPFPPLAPLFVDVQFRAPGVIGQPTIADAFMVWRRDPSDSIALVDAKTPEDSLLAGEYVQFSLDVPRTGLWYKYILLYSNDSLIAVGDSIEIRSAEYQTR